MGYCFNTTIFRCPLFDDFSPCIALLYIIQNIFWSLSKLNGLNIKLSYIVIGLHFQTVYSDYIYDSAMAQVAEMFWRKYCDHL